MSVRACGECGSVDLELVEFIEPMYWRKECRSCASTGPFVPVCGFCKGKPVGNAATWLDDVPRPPAPCPRCGEVIPA